MSEPTKEQKKRINALLEWKRGYQWKWTKEHEKRLREIIALIESSGDEKENNQNEDR